LSWLRARRCRGRFCRNYRSGVCAAKRVLIRLVVLIGVDGGVLFDDVETRPERAEQQPHADDKDRNDLLVTHPASLILLIAAVPAACFDDRLTYQLCRGLLF